MATSTTNLNLIKPSGSDKIRIAQINQNMDILDEKIGPVGSSSLQAQIAAVDSGLAIVSNGNTHVALTSGQYVYIRNHSSLSEGLYKATAAISANATLSTSNVTKVSTGGMNELKSDIDSVNSQFVTKSSGSMHDIKKSGLYYVTGNVSDKPTGNGGYYSVTVYNNDLLVGIFCSTDGYTFNVQYSNNTWTYQQIALVSQVKLKRITKTYKNITLPSTDNPYAQIDDYNGLGVNTGYYLVAMNIRGWNNTHVGSMSLVKSSNGSEFYVLGSSGGNIGSITVEYFFVPSVDTI